MDATTRRVTLLRWLGWLLAAAALTAVLGVLAAQLPRRLRLLGVFGLLWGWLVGLVLAQLALKAGVRGGRGVLVLAGLLACAGLLEFGWLAQRRFAADQRREIGADPFGALPSPEAMPPDFAREVEAARAERRRIIRDRTSFTAWLVHRTKTDWGFDGLPPRWAWVAWILEVAAAGLAAARSASREFRPELTSADAQKTRDA